MKLKLTVLLLLLLGAVPLRAQQIVRVVSGVATLDVERNSKFKVILDQNITSIVLAPSVGVPNLTAINVLFIQTGGTFTVTFGGNTSGSCTINNTGGTACQLQFDSSSNTWFITGGVSVSGTTSVNVAVLPALPCTNGNSVYLTTNNPVTGYYDCVNLAWQYRPQPDPPITQSYTLTTTGAQTGINLTSNAIDTQQLSWRPVGFTTTITEPFNYVNSDLHTTNTNWVYQAGTFTVSSNVTYGSSAGNSLAYRSDGPTAVANEWAQATLVETATSATQNHGPCVYVSTAATTAYCLQLATTTFNIIKIVAGTITSLNTIGISAATGDVVGIQVVGASPASITAFKNGVVVGTASDSSIASGSTGLFNAANATANGVSNFQSGTGPFPQCSIALDSSPDNVNWTAGGAIPAQSCTVAGSQQTSVTSNYVRVNLNQWNTAATNVQVVYAGRLSPAAANGGTTPVSNGQWVNKGEVVWFQFTTQGVGNVAVQSWVRILQANGTILNSGPLTVAACATGGGGIVPGNANTPSGVGYGYIIPASGNLQAAISQINTSGFAQGAFYINQYLMTQMPSGGTTNSCTNSLGTNNPNGILLSSAPVGSFYPMGFMGTTLNFISPWSIPGYNSILPIANPAAGADFTFTTSTTNNENPRICVTGVSYTLTTDATVASRVNALQIQLGSGPILTWIAGTAATASQTVNYSYTPGASLNSINTSGAIFSQSIPFNNGQPVCQDGGSSPSVLTIKSVTTAKGAADQLSNIKVWTTVQQDAN